MKRIGDLWPDVTSWENLVESARLAARAKRQRADVARFLHELEPNLCQLQADLLDGSYRPAGYRTFWIHDPKPRQISAAPFRDRIVHHALTRVLEPVFEPRFTDFSFASRTGYGQHPALELARKACGEYRFVMKGDVRKYFPSIDHEILKGLLRRAVKCPDTLCLADRIIDGSNEQEEVLSWFPGDDLFSPLDRRRGLPIGNQTSQFFANVYLNPLDHFVLRQIKPALYLRYVDDFLLFSDDKAGLWRAGERIGAFLEGLRLRLHERKFQVHRCSSGVTFLGWRLFPDRMRLARANVIRIRRRLKGLVARYHAGRIGFDQVNKSVQAWLGHAAFGDTWSLRKRLFGQLILVGAEHGRNAGRLLEQ